MVKGGDPRIVGDARRGLTPGRLLGALVLGAVVALPFGSAALAGWADRLPDAFSAVQDWAHGWDGMMQRAGLGAPYAMIHRRVNDWTAAP